MESWSYISRAEDFVHNESVPATDGSVRNENGLMGWELKASSAFGTGSFMSSSNQEGLKNPQLIELGSAERITSNTDKGSVTDVFSSKFGCGEVYSTPIANSGEEESSIKLSSSVMESNYRDTPLIDLKLGRFPDHKDAQGNVNPNFSSAESSMPAKRLRAGKLTTQIPYCQVYGCKKDLSNCKDYHKRHKVCEIHSKTAKVIVNGIDQRFCQQCSRFHLLSEFDDGKRSCRKRLAGHNERRRKPHVGMHSGRGGRFFQPYNGTRFNGTSFALSSSVYRDRLPSSLLHAQKYEMNDWYRNLRVENDADYVPRHGISYSESQYPDVHDDELIEVTRSKNNSFLHNMSSPGCVSRSLFRNSSIGSEELTTFDSFPTGQRLPAAASNSGCALSLLSCQSQIAPNIPSSIPTGLPLITPSSHSTYSTSTSGVSNMFPTSGITSADETHMDPILISDGIGSDKYGINEFLPSSSAEFRNTKNQISCGDGSTTINLLQLSSQLQQVEHQRQYMQVKQEDDTLFGLRIT